MGLGGRVDFAEFGGYGFALGDFVEDGAHVGGAAAGGGDAVGGGGGWRGVVEFGERGWRRWGRGPTAAGGARGGLLLRRTVDFFDCLKGIDALRVPGQAGCVVLFYVSRERFEYTIECLDPLNMCLVSVNNNQRVSPRKG